MRFRFRLSLPILLISVTLGPILLVCGLDRLLYDGAWSLLPEDTEYAPAFSEKGFRALRAPLRADEVVQVIGEPLEKIRDGTGREFWTYSRSPSDTHYRRRRVVLLGETAIECIHEFYVD
jgi:hypothetical protein